MTKRKSKSKGIGPVANAAAYGNMLKQAKASKRSRRRRNRRARGAPAMSQGNTSKSRRRRGRKGAGGADFAVSDGLNTGRVVINNDSIVDQFVMRREKIMNINGSTGFVNQSLYINPGNTLMFPIFSGIAAKYECYRIRKLRFLFETEAYTASGSNQGAGKNIMVTNYDVSDAAFIDDTSAENYCGAVKGAPYARMVHQVNSKKGDKRGFNPLTTFFVNPSANLAAPATDSSQSKFYDVGLFQFITNSQVGSAEIGELYVEYSFEMIRPKQQLNSLGINAVSAHITEGAATTATAAAPLGTTGGILKAGSTLPSVATTNTFTLPYAGNYQVSASFSTNSGNIGASPSMTPGSNITALNYSFDDSAGYRNSYQGACGCWIGEFAVSAPGTGAANTITIGGLTSMTTGETDVWINQIPSAITSVIIGEDNLKSQIEKTNRLESQVDWLTRNLSRLLGHPVIDDDEKSPYVNLGSYDHKKANLMREMVEWKRSVKQDLKVDTDAANISKDNKSESSQGATRPNSPLRTRNNNKAEATAGWFSSGK